MQSSFSKRITGLRRERGLSQKAVAQSLGISQALLSHYEKGIRECGHDFLIRAADYFGVSCDYLLGRTIIRDLSLPDHTAEGSAVSRSKESVLAAISAAFEALEELEQNPDKAPAGVLKRLSKQL